MLLREIGRLVRERRLAVGLTQERLARLAGLSRATIVSLEGGTLADLGVAKLAQLLDLVGLRLDASEDHPHVQGLRLVSRTASVSYRTELRPAELADAMATGTLPSHMVAHVSTLLDEAPLPLVVCAVEEAARSRHVPPREIWRHLQDWARALGSVRAAWA